MSKSRLRRTSVLASIAVGLALSSAAGAQAANNPGTGDTGFFTFRPSAVAGTQINVASGNALVRTRDLADSDGNYHVVVDRAYNSLASDAFSILSPRWGFDVGPATKLAVQNNGDVLVTGPSGYRLLFVKQANGTFNAPVGFDGSLVASSSGWTLSRTSQGDQFGFNGSGQLAWTKDSQARDFTVQGTSAAGRDVLSSYGTNSGRRVNLSYTGDSLVREMDDPSSGHHYYGYTNGKLTSYRSPSGAETTYHYGTNGYLDKITEAGGTTVELTTTSAGKVQSITTTLPGAVGQTTSFVYTRRPYKTDVTGPDGVRRTYAYDDDWRVTRQYNPDVKPTVTATGELKDLADQYVGPNRTYALSVMATEPDGAGLRRIGLQRSNGDEITGSDVPCTTTPFDLVCPTSFTAQLDASFAAVPEGRQSIRAAARDDEQNAGYTSPWTVLVDRSAPTAPHDIALAMFDPANGESTAAIDWDAGADPNIEPGVPGSGVALEKYRYKIGNGAFTAWAAADVSSVDIPGVNAGDAITVEVKDVDGVGNESAVATGTVTAVQQDETPAVQDAAADYYTANYGGSHADAVAWLSIADRSSGIAQDVADSDAGSGYGGVWIDQASKRIRVGLTPGTPRAQVQGIINSRNIASNTEIVAVDYRQSQLEGAQPGIIADLDSLVAAELVEISRAADLNAIKIAIAADATAAQRAQVQSVADSATVRVVVTDSTEPTFETEDLAKGCRFYNKGELHDADVDNQDEFSTLACNAPLRGGMRIYHSPLNTSDKRRVCSVGFQAVVNNGPSNDGIAGRDVALTAGHCFAGDINLSWDARTYSDFPSNPSGGGRGPWYQIGRESGRSFHNARGDAGMIFISETPWLNHPTNRIFVKDNSTGTRDEAYPIKKVDYTAKGDIVCMAGSTNGLKCGKVKDTGLFKNRAGFQASVDACMGKGDSGGPVFKKGVAKGMVASRHSLPVPGHCTTYYQGARGAETELQVKIRTR